MTGITTFKGIIVCILMHVLLQHFSLGSPASQIVSTRLNDVLQRSFVRPRQCRDLYAAIVNHTMCLGQIQRSHLPSNTEKHTIEEIHNKIRGEVTPPAVDMLKIKYNTALEIEAHLWAEQCQLTHDRLHARFKPGQFQVGQNIAVVKSRKATWSEVISIWENEKQYFIHADNASDINLIGNYTQMIWAETSILGCAVAHCTGVYFYVCNYATSLDERRLSLPYSSGVTCDKCTKHCTTNKTNIQHQPEPKNLCDCSGIICQNGGVLNLETCKCQCLSHFYTGDYCALECENKTDPVECGQAPLDIAACETDLMTPFKCPWMCSMCPYASNGYVQGSFPTIKTTKTPLGSEPNISSPGHGTILSGDGALSPSIGAISHGNGSIPPGNGAILTGNGAVSPSNGTISPGNGAISPGTGAMSPGIGAISPGNGDISPGTGAISPGTGTISPGTGAISPGTGAISPGTGTISPGTGAISPGTGAISPGTGAISPGTGAMSPGTGAISPGTGAISPGTGAISPGTGTISPGTGAISPGTGAISPGTGTMSPGTGAISPGTGAISPGTGAISPGTGAISPGTGTISPGTGAMSPGTGAISPGTGAMSPGIGVISPVNGAISPSTGAMSPGTGAMSPGTGAMSSGTGAISPGTGAISHGTGAMSPGIGVISPVNGAISPSNGTISIGNGVISHGNGAIPSGNVAISPLANIRNAGNATNGSTTSTDNTYIPKEFDGQYFGMTNLEFDLDLGLIFAFVFFLLILLLIIILLTKSSKRKTRRVRHFSEKLDF